MSDNSPIIVWFRNDLRLRDNPALRSAYDGNAPIIPLYIYDPDAMDRDYGGAQKLWLHHALTSLADDLSDRGVKLLIRQGESQKIIDEIVKETDAKAVYWNRSYEGWSITRDKSIKESLKDRDIDAQSFKANVLFEPWEIKNGSGDNYKVFTPFWKKCMEYREDITNPLPAPEKIKSYDVDLDSISVDELGFRTSLDWKDSIEDYWDITEKGAWQRMRNFFDDALNGYKEDRNIPSRDTTSRLSPYLRHGMISPRAIWHEANAYAATNTVNEKDLNHFLSEVGWREFSFHLLYYYPDLRDTPLQDKFTKFPWDENNKFLKAWQKGQTGYPMVDAGMRQLWQTGWMHNRIRMIVGSLLVKHLLQPWQNGEDWFWDTLVDACPANNTAGWQWVSGCGADAAPYFRVFNPITQGDKFDAYAYVREYIPEIAHLPDKYLFSPWEAESDILENANIKMGETYPYPLVDHKEGRDRALKAFDDLKAA